MKTAKEKGNEVLRYMLEHVTLKAFFSCFEQHLDYIVYGADVQGKFLRQVLGRANGGKNVAPQQSAVRAVRRADDRP